MQEIITPYDFVLLPVYLFLFYLIVRGRSKKYEKEGLRKIFVTAFICRMAGSIFYCLLLQYYYGYGDSFGFYLGGNVISRMIQQDITSFKYFFSSAKEIVIAAKSMGFGDDVPVSMPNDSNVFIMKLSALFSFFTFNKYIIISICFGFLSFIGIWKLFYVFYQLSQKKNIKLLAIFILFFPSLWFWGSGLLKEPICVWALGTLVYLFYKNFIWKKFSIPDMLIMVLLLIILTIVKNYITAILLISFFVIGIYTAIAQIRTLVFRTMIWLLLLITIIVTIITFDISPYLNSIIENSFAQIQQLQHSYQETKEESEEGGLTFSLSNLSPSLDSILANSPGVVATCLFRPFVWESNKVVIFLASLEALLTIVITVYVFWRSRFYRFFLYLFSDPFLLFCFIFSVLFALVIGFTTFNFGTMIRYKIIFLPFYFFLLIQIYNRSRQHQRI